MTTRPTDEEILALANELRDCEEPLAALTLTIDSDKFLRAWLAERQAARDGVREADDLIDAYESALLEERNSGFLPPEAQRAAVKCVEHNRNRLRAALQSVEKPVSVPKKANYPKPDPNTGEDKGPCCAHAYADGWNACREAMLSTSPQPQQSVLDLLALIHRDGGHYTGEHGIEKSIQDAFDKIAELRTQQAVPDGLKLVPIEPDASMISAAVASVEISDSYYQNNLFDGEYAKEAWKAMLSAAPAYNGKKDET